MRPIKQALFSSRTADKFVVRLPDGMRERIADAAHNHYRSMNSEIISRLEQSLFQPSMAADEPHLQITSAELAPHESGLLQHFRQLSKRQQNALVALIAHDTEQGAENN